MHPKVDSFTYEEFILNAFYTLSEIHKYEIRIKASKYENDSFSDYKSSIMSIRYSEECPELISKDAISGRDWKIKFIRNVGKMDLENSKTSRVLILTGM